MGANSRKAGVGRPNVTWPFASRVREILETEPGLPTSEVLRRVRLKGYQGGKTALYHLVAALRMLEIAPDMPLSGKAWNSGDNST